MKTYDIYTENDVIEFDTLDDAIEYAEKNGYTSIEGGYDTFEKCEFCGEWYDVSELNIENYCERCREAIRAHGFAVDPRKHNGEFYSF